jgi:hypothetical protein
MAASLDRVIDSGLNKAAMGLRVAVVTAVVKYYEKENLSRPYRPCPRQAARDLTVQTKMRDLVRLVGLDKMTVTLVTDRDTNRLHKIFKFENLKYTWGAVAVGLLSPSLIQPLDLSLYSPSEIIGLANFLEETRIFGSSSADGTTADADARAFLNSFYGGGGNHASSSVPFLKLTASSVSKVRLYLEPPSILAEWAVNLGLIHSDEIDKIFGVPNLCFLNTPWDDERFATKTLMLINTILLRSERLTKDFHPRILAALGHNVFSQRTSFKYAYGSRCPTSI